MPRGLKKTNEYAAQFGKLYAKVPKSVLAAIAYSFADRLVAGSEGTDPLDIFIDEWRVLNENGIISQKPETR